MGEHAAPAIDELRRVVDAITALAEAAPGARHARAVRLELSGARPASPRDARGEHDVLRAARLQAHGVGSMLPSTVSSMPSCGRARASARCEARTPVAELVEDDVAGADVGDRDLAQVAAAGDGVGEGAVRVDQAPREPHARRAGRPGARTRRTRRGRAAAAGPCRAPSGRSPASSSSCRARATPSCLTAHASACSAHGVARVARGAAGARQQQRAERPPRRRRTRRAGRGGGPSQSHDRATRTAPTPVGRMRGAHATRPRFCPARGTALTPLRRHRLAQRLVEADRLDVEQRGAARIGHHGLRRQALDRAAARPRRRPA